MTVRLSAQEKVALLRQHLDDGVPLTRLAEHAGVPVRTLSRWATAYRAEGSVASLQRKTRSDHGHRQLSEDLVATIEALALRRPAPTTAFVHRRVGDLARDQGLPAPSYSTVRGIVAAIDPGLRTLALNGDTAYRDQFELVLRRTDSRPNEHWQADHTLLDVQILDRGGRAVRPWLTVVLDDYSRAVAGYTLLLGAPTAEQTALALHQAINRKANPAWPVQGLPDVLYSDHGSDFTSNRLERVCLDTHTRLIHSRVGIPQGRGKIERFYGTITSELLPHLPGHIPHGTSGQPISPPRLTLEQLDAALERFIVEEYHQRSHSETGQPPAQHWLAGGWIPRAPAHPEDLDLLLLTAAAGRIVQRDGIRLGRGRQHPRRPHAHPDLGRTPRPGRTPWLPLRRGQQTVLQAGDGPHLQPWWTFRHDRAARPAGGHLVPGLGPNPRPSLDPGPPGPRATSCRPRPGLAHLRSPRTLRRWIPGDLGPLQQQSGPRRISPRRPDRGRARRDRRRRRPPGQPQDATEDPGCRRTSRHQRPAGSRRHPLGRLHPHRNHRSRPPAGKTRPPCNATRYRRTEKKVFTITAALHSERVSYDAVTDGCFPLITNDTVMTGAEVLAAYHYQPNLERRNHMLKGPQEVAPVYLETAHRIEALLLCHFLAMLTEALIEREIRTSMSTQGLAGIPLYPELRNCPAPSAPRILEVFDDITRHQLINTADDAIVQTFQPQLTPLQEQILDLLHLPASVYSSLGVL